MINKAKKLLHKYFGYNSFRKGQEEIMSNILDKKDILGIMPTGGGKSICYQIPAMVFDGITIVISPLISLMKDQVDTLNEVGIPASYINSSLSYDEVAEVLHKARNKEIKLLYVAPERTAVPSFVNLLKSLDISMVAIDEAHCISQWGHDFRPSYMNIRPFINEISNGKKILVSSFTATATPSVKDDIVKNLKLNNPEIIITGFDRPNLYFSVIHGVNKNNFILDYLQNNPNKSGIIYVSTRKNVEKLYDLFDLRGFKVGKYHAGMTKEERKESQEKFSFDKYDIMIATNAFGMGIDKSNVRFVIHYNMTKKMESYYQEAGRAGRDGDNAECILLFSPQDIILQKYFIENSEATEEIKENEMNKLQKMIEYCYLDTCLRDYILNYFGEDSNIKNCKNCSSCNFVPLTESDDLQDITIEAQKIISCVVRMKERFGTTLIAQVLTGSKNKKVLQYKFEELSTYNIMNGYSRKDVSAMINYLISQKFLIMSNDEYPIVKLTAKSALVLKNEDKVFKKILAKTTFVSKNKSKNTSAEYDTLLFEKLRELRMDLANKESVPPYIVFSDATLKEMCRNYPTNDALMLNIKGVGEKKLFSYGRFFIDKISSHIEKK